MTIYFKLYKNKTVQKQFCQEQGNIRENPWLFKIYFIEVENYCNFVFVYTHP